MNEIQWIVYDCLLIVLAAFDKLYQAQQFQRECEIPCALCTYAEYEKLVEEVQK